MDVFRNNHVRQTVHGSDEFCKSHYISRVSPPLSRDYDENECRTRSTHTYKPLYLQYLFLLSTFYFFAFLISFLFHFCFILISPLSLREMSTRSFSGEGRPARKTDNFTAISEMIVYKMWEPRCLTNLWASTECYKVSCPLRSAFSFSRRWFVLIFSISVLHWAHFI
jgi:hypothetical protein